MGEISSALLQYAIEYGTRFLGGLIVLAIGWVLINAVNRAVVRTLSRQDIDATLRPVIASTLSLLLKILVILASAATMGIETTSFVAVLGSFGLAAGLAMQGSLSNLAGGFLILLFRPLRVGDHIKAQGTEGMVKEIQLLVTILETNDKITIYVPNGSLANGQITNFSQAGILRLNVPILVTHYADIDKARAQLLALLTQNPLALKDPTPTVVVSNVDINGIELTMRPWCEPHNKPALTVQLLEKTPKALQEIGIALALSDK